MDLDMKQNGYKKVRLPSLRHRNSTVSNRMLSVSTTSLALSSDILDKIDQDPRFYDDEGLTPYNTVGARNLLDKPHGIYQRLRSWQMDVPELVPERSVDNFQFTLQPSQSNPPTSPLHQGAGPENQSSESVCSGNRSVPLMVSVTCSSVGAFIAGWI